MVCRMMHHVYCRDIKKGLEDGKHEDNEDAGERRTIIAWTIHCLLLIIKHRHYYRVEDNVFYFTLIIGMCLFVCF